MAQLVTYHRRCASPGAALALLKMNTPIDVRAVLPTIRVPTLIMHHTGDRDAKIEEGRFLAEHIPGARFVEFQGVDHSWWTEDRDEIIDEIEEMLTGNKPAREADRVLATVLFTDIVGSTQGVVDRGDRAWLELLKAASRLWCGRSLPGFADAKSIRSAIRLSRFSTARRARFAAPATSATLLLSLGSKSVLDCTPEKSNCSVTISLASPSISERAWPRRLSQMRSWSPGTVRDLVAGSAIAFADRGVRVLKGVPGERQLFAANPL